MRLRFTVLPHQQKDNQRFGKEATNPPVKFKATFSLNKVLCTVFGDSWGTINRDNDLEKKR